ncbi:uncharacterized protein [Odocoileus virginianus]|uniref:Uncharacterized protein n=1 Tax=Odocoileus virginianus TaxID=9874 RepID=A0ABM4I638_ODOVR
MFRRIASLLLANCRRLLQLQCALSASLSLSPSPLLKAIQPRLAGSQILSGFALCALDCTRLCRSCNRFAVPLSSPYPLVYFRNRCNLHSNHARGGGGGREGAGKRPCPLLPSSCLSPRQSPPPPRRVANRSPGIQRKLRSGHRSEESPCVTRPGSRDGVFGAVGVSPLEDLAAGDLPDPGIEPASPELQAVSCNASGFFTTEPPGVFFQVVDDSGRLYQGKKKRILTISGTKPNPHASSEASTRFDLATRTEGDVILKNQSVLAPPSRRRGRRSGHKISGSEDVFAAVHVRRNRRALG